MDGPDGKVTVYWFWPIGDSFDFNAKSGKRFVHADEYEMTGSFSPDVGVVIEPRHR